MKEIVQQIRDRATLEYLESWLAQLPPEMNVGKPGYFCECPISQYFWEIVIASLPESPQINVHVSEDKVCVTGIQLERGEDGTVFTNYPTEPHENIPKVPAWIADVIKKVDSVPDRNISAGQVLQIVREVAIALEP